eukprot:jgi/Ulvmu1/2386/UM130_0019.1
MSASRRIAVDMEATRLVFVMLKGAKPMRKVAIPITDTTSWHAFESQVKSKLRIRAIQAMTMAATGEVVTSLSQLQDIDQLHVIEAADVPIVQQPPQVTSRQHTGLEIMSAANGMDSALPQSTAAAARPDEYGNAKYVKKKGVFNSFLSGFRQGSLLPITTRDGELPHPRRSRRRTRVLTLRNLTIALCAVLLMLWLFRVYYQSGGTAALSAQRDVGDGWHEGDPMKPPEVTPPQRLGRSRPVRDPALRSPDQKVPDAVETRQQEGVAAGGGVADPHAEEGVKSA